MPCKYAIIPVAGYGTRRLPVAKAVEKCMLPVLNRPVIDYSIQDCIEAGIEHIIVVVGAERGEQFKRFYGRSEALEDYLRTHGKSELLGDIAPPEGVTFEFVVQPPEVPYGTATPVALARHLVPKGEQAVVLMGDDLIYTDGDDSNPITALMEAAGEGTALLTTEVGHSDVSLYGVLAINDDDTLDYLVERPNAEDAPSTMINISYYLFTSDLLDEIETFYHEPPEPGKEKYINVVPFKRYKEKGGVMKVVRAPGTYLDTGTLEKWLQANAFIAKAQGLNI